MTPQSQQQHLRWGSCSTNIPSVTPLKAYKLGLKLCDEACKSVDGLPNCIDAVLTIEGTHWAAHAYVIDLIIVSAVDKAFLQKTKMLFVKRTSNEIGKCAPKGSHSRY